jgi:hypothetical protein
MNKKFWSTLVIKTMFACVYIKKLVKTNKGQPKPNLKVKKLNLI